MNLGISPLTRTEFDTTVEWAAQEGWNPGLHDADVLWNTDPEGYLGAHLEGELVATGSVVSYSGKFGFMGFFIVRPDLRGQKIGTQLWFHRRDLLLSRLAPGAAIGMDGVFEMQDWYARGGFAFSHRNLRMRGSQSDCGFPKPSSQNSDAVVHLSEVPFNQVLAYDTAHFGCDRSTFLSGWLALTDSFSYGWLNGETLRGMGTIRRCREGWKIGPLFADDAEIAEALFQSLTQHTVDDPFWLDVPECNAEAMGVAERYNLQRVFGCARMFHGPAPKLPWNQIFGITTFELG